MRQPSITILLILLMASSIHMPAFSAIKGGVEYSIPTDYSKLSEKEVEDIAKKYYFLALKLENGKVNSDMTNALMLYNMLQNINPENIEYAIKLGVLYDKVNKDRFAKGYFSKAIGIDKFNPEPYFYLGEFYYKRELYRKALKYYNEAYVRGYRTNYDVLFKIGDIYEKFGDTRSALKYLKEASLQNPNSDLDNKIKRIEMQSQTNKEYYSNTRIREKV